jgi:hypothetical protein
MVFAALVWSQLSSRLHFTSTLWPQVHRSPRLFSLLKAPFQLLVTCRQGSLQGRPTSPHLKSPDFDGLKRARSARTLKICSLRAS